MRDGALIGRPGAGRVVAPLEALALDGELLGGGAGPGMGIAGIRFGP